MIKIIFETLLILAVLGVGFLVIRDEDEDIDLD